MSIEKQVLHPRNKHRSRYDFKELTRTLPELLPFVALNDYGDESIDFSDPLAVKVLNKALLKQHYQVNHWDIPAGYLCPPIPGRADYIHYLADLLAGTNGNTIPTGKKIRGLDVGTGANCIYPIIGHQEYGWTFVGTDVDQTALKSAKNLVAVNPELSGTVFLRPQPVKHQIFKGILKPGETFDFTICNPPFHASAEEAQAGTQRKLRNLGKHQGKSTVLNFGGQHAELWCEGGEVGFIRRMIDESLQLKQQCLWFTTLVSKSMNLPFIVAALERAKVADMRTVEMAQGQKISRFVAWTFLSPAAQQDWVKKW